MLQNIRERIKGWVAGIVIVLVGSTFVLFGVEYYVQQSSSKKSSVAEVNGHKITEQELTQAYQQLQKQEQQAMKGAPLTPDQNKQIKQMALNDLITTTAMQDAAHQAGFYVSLDQAKALLIQAPAFQVNGQFSNERFQKAIYATGLTPAEFFSHVQNSILMGQLQAGLQGSEFVLPNEVQELASLWKQTRSFGYFTISVSSFKNKVKISDADINSYYSHNLDKFKTPEKVQVSYLLLSPASLEKSVSVTDAEIKQYYDSNPSNFTSVKRWQIERYLVPVSAQADKGNLEKAKADAAALQATLQKNEKPSEKPILSTMTQDQVSGPVATMMGNLKAGEVSAPFQTTEGFNVIKVLKIDVPKQKTFSDAKDEIKKALLHQKVQQLLTSKSEQLSNLAYTNPNTLDVAAKSLNIPVEKSDWLTRQDNTGIFADPKIMDVAFSDEILTQGNNSTPIELKDGSLMVLRVSAHEKSVAEPLASVSEKIRDLLTDQQSQREAGLTAYQLQTELQKGVAPSELAKKFSFTWATKENIQRTNKSVGTQMLSAVFNLPSDIKKPEVTSVLIGGKEYAVVLLTSVNTPVNPVINEKEHATLLKGLMVIEAQNQYRLYMKSVMAAAKIKIGSAG